ncbi:type II toxin-antitoxin system CcdA family antitoxin [Streptomyces shenzhenensis]
MTSRKQRVTVSLPADVLEAVNSEAGGNLSAYAAKALMAQAVRDSAARLAQWQESRLDTLAEFDELQLDPLDELNGGTAA